MEPNQPPLPPQSPAPATAPEAMAPSEGPPAPAGGPAPPPPVEAAAAAAPSAEREGPPAKPPPERAPGQAPPQGAAPPDQARGRERRGERQGQRPEGQRPFQRQPGQGRPGGGGQARDQRGPARPQHQPWSKPDFLARAVESGIDRTFIEGALEFARSLGPYLGPAQVRSIYGEVMRQELSGFDPARFLLLKPRLAYLAARAGRSEMRELRTVLERGVEKVCAEGIPEEERQARFERFSRCLEAILSYHKTYERKGGERA